MAQNALAQESRRATARAREESERGQRLINELWLRVYQPVFRTAEKRWDALQNALRVMDDVFCDHPGSSTKSSDDCHRATITGTIAQHFPDFQSCVCDGMKYAERRDRIFRRRVHDLDELMAKPDALRSITAAFGFSWALVCLILAPVSEEIRRSLDDESILRFVSFVLHVGGQDQYILLRAAETALLHDREVASAVVEGTMSQESREMELETQFAWLDLQESIESDGSDR